MTGWQALIGTLCPSQLSIYLNSFNAEESGFSTDYIRELYNHCPYDYMVDDALCAKCWLDFLRGEVK